jgi:2-desacetyl-2-hydroxyethyl bacteriochlorophyllide A dehydrogenase
MDVILYQIDGSLEVGARPVPKPKGDQVLLQVAYAGLCGSDLAIAEGGHPRAKPPLVMGHEFSGYVADLGERVDQGLEIGDRVAVYPILSCGDCYACRMGSPNVCQALGLIGIDQDGGFAEYALVPQGAALRLPSGVGLLEGSLIEPLAVCVHAARLSDLQVGDVVVVTGAGPIGLLMGQLARSAGAGKVILTEVAPNRMAAAQALGFEVVDAREKGGVAEVLERTGGRGADLVFEATGHPSVAPTLMDLVRIRGQIVALGVFEEPVAVDLQALNFQEIRLIGSRVYEIEDFCRAISLAAQGRVDPRSIVSDLGSLKEAPRLFALARAARVGKVVFEMLPEQEDFVSEEDL